MISAVISDFGGVLTKPLMNAFNRVQDDMDVPIEAYGPAFEYSLEHDGVHPLFALERGEISEGEFIARLERGFAAVLDRPVSLHGLGEHLIGAMEPNQELFDHYDALRRERNLRFALCTNNVREWEARWRALLPIDELFEVVVDSAFVGTRKGSQPSFRFRNNRSHSQSSPPELRYACAGTTTARQLSPLR